MCILYDVYQFIHTLQHYKKNEIPHAENQTLYVLGNGPSIKGIFARKDYLEMLSRSSTIAVNHFVETDLYEKIKPELYVMIDGIALGTDSNMTAIDKEKANRIRNALLTKTTWDMMLFVPYASKDSTLVNTLSNNNHIRIVYLNTSYYRGKSQKLQFCLWKHQWGAPRMENVLAAAIYIGILMQFQTIYLLGADHDWFKHISVDENNNVFQDMEHFYKEKATKSVGRINNENRPENLADIFGSLAIVFQTYYELNEFAEMRGVELYNATPQSYIDGIRKILKIQDNYDA